MKRRIMACILALALLLGAAGTALADTTYSASTTINGSAKRTNIQLAASAIDGIKLKYGDSFSFNDVVGRRSESRGYVEAENGRGVEVVGGGVAQAAATLYLALRKLGSAITYTDFATYGSKFTDDYVSDGDLAVLTDYDGGTDFAFVNYAGEMRISMWVSGSSVNCVLTLTSMGNGSSWFEDDDDDDYTPAKYSAGSGSGYVDVTYNDADTQHNVELAASNVYDTTVHRGETFSFNDTVGPRTKKYGFRSGTNGRGSDVMGGGVAQVASAIWMAVKDRSDISVIEKSTYGKKYNQDYVDSAADAIVTDYKAGTDFTFKYTGYGSITLYTYVSGGSLVCDVVVNN